MASARLRQLELVRYTKEQMQNIGIGQNANKTLQTGLTRGKTQRD